jgi:Tfp pilus assembly protein FimT
MKHATAGFSVIELTIVLGLVGVVALFSLSMGTDTIGRSTVASERDLFVSLLLRGARAESLANLREVSHSIKINNDGHEYILFDGTTFSSSTATNRHVPYTNSEITVTNTGGNTIIFDQLSGDASTGTGTITISNGDKSQQLTLRSSGQIDW